MGEGTSADREGGEEPQSVPWMTMGIVTGT